MTITARAARAMAAAASVDTDVSPLRPSSSATAIESGAVDADSGGWSLPAVSVVVDRALVGTGDAGVGAEDEVSVNGEPAEGLTTLTPAAVNVGSAVASSTVSSKIGSQTNE